ncbi:MAG: VWA domain-containing protein, partial [Gallionella sp.]
MDKLADLHFLRPEWLYALLPLVLLLWLQWRRRLLSRSWQSVVSPQLLPHLLIGQCSRQRPWKFVLLLLGGVLAIVAMAGPAWKKLEVPVFRQPSSLVLLLDLSRSMDAADVKPSRLERAQMKLRDILNQQKEGETALIVYAASPYVVSPLTSDARTIASQLGSLGTDLMPAQGSRPDRAIVMAQQLLQQSGAKHGGVLLISDGLDGDESDELKDAIRNLAGAGHSLSVLGVGTLEGAPIPATNGGFLKDKNGAIVLPRLDDAGLAALARQGNGNYRRMGTDDSDFQAALAPFKRTLDRQQSKKAEGMNSDQWRDDGPWLLLPLLLLGALAFRRGYLLVVLMLVLPLPRPAYAIDWPMDWNSLWHNKNQRAQQAMQANDPKQAAELFNDPEWHAAANYRAGNYQEAAKDLQDLEGVDARYNRGNALAKQGQLQEALKAYDEALKHDQKNADAKFNHDLIEELLKQQQHDQQQNKDGQQGDKQDQKGKSDSKDKQDKSGQQGDKSGEQQDSRQPGDQQQDGKQSDGKKQDAGKENSGKPNSGKDGKDEQQQDELQKSANEAAQQNGKPEDAQQKNAHRQSGKPDDKADKGDKPEGAVEGQQDASELQQADKQWLRRIPDDPGGLWRRKFLYQYKQQQQQRKSEDKT